MFPKPADGRISGRAGSSMTGVAKRSIGSSRTQESPRARTPKLLIGSVGTQLGQDRVCVLSGGEDTGKAPAISSFLGSEPP